MAIILLQGEPGTAKHATSGLPGPRGTKRAHAETERAPSSVSLEPARAASIRSVGQRRAIRPSRPLLEEAQQAAAPAGERLQAALNRGGPAAAQGLGGAAINRAAPAPAALVAHGSYSPPLPTMPPSQPLQLPPQPLPQPQLQRHVRPLERHVPADGMRPSMPASYYAYSYYGGATVTTGFQTLRYGPVAQLPVGASP